MTRLPSFGLWSCLVLALALGGLPVRTAAAADAEGEAGRITRITLNTASSEKYASYHGSLTLRRTSAGKSDVYYWGGSTCPAQKLSESQLRVLSDALHNRGRTQVLPRYAESEAQAGTRCLVAFDLVGG